MIHWIFNVVGNAVVVKFKLSNPIKIRKSEIRTRKFILCHLYEVAV